ncbi:MAG: glycosyltransferase family 4 protein [Candidatus Aminicenantes bacterium]|nr:glycosyltransferase family 4 protein [Candidatus Aminicenantes bacterium]
MRIAFITTEYVNNKTFDGGLANYIRRVSLALARMGHQPLVIFFSDCHKESEADGVKIIQVKYTRRWWFKILNLFTLRRFTTFLELLNLSLLLNAKLKEEHGKQEIHIVQYTSLGGVGFFRLRGIPSVIRVSSLTSLCRKKGGYDRLGPFAARQQELLERWAFKKADSLFGPSYVIAAAVKQDAKRDVRVIESPFVLDNEELDTSLYEKFLKDKKYLFYFGKLNVLKGMVVIAGILEKLLARYPELYFVFVGKEDAGYEGKTMREYLLEKAGDYHDRLIFLGALSHARLYPMLERAQAVVLPSLIDNFPNACIEAMAFKRVVIGTYDTSFEQLIEDGRSGFLAAPEDATSLYEAVSRALDLSEAARKKMGEKAAQRIEDLEPRKVVEQLVRFYEEIVGEQ